MSDWQTTTDGRHVLTMRNGAPVVIDKNRDGRWEATAWTADSQHCESLGVRDSLDEAKQLVQTMASCFADRRPRCQCGSTEEPVYLAGHRRCLKCGRNVDPCCDGAPL